MKEMMNFRALAKNLISLKKHENVVKVLGVALDDGKFLYSRVLIHSYPLLFQAILSYYKTCTCSTFRYRENKVCESGG